MPAMRTVWWLITLAALCWFVMFAPWTRGYVNFWAAMLASTVALGGSALWLGRAERREVYAFKPLHLLYGLGAVAFLYGFFWAGKQAATALLPFAQGQIQHVYDTRSQAPPWLIALLLLGWIGPAEEIFWRGFVQFRMARRYGPWPGLIGTTAIYALVHIWSGNFMLVMAAAIAGAFWGLLFQRTRSLWPGIISHALWDALIFVWAPL
jgi:membrane protease YdiL (CAAX protease family)